MYKLNQNNSSISRLSDGANIPADQKNIDYVAYLQWLSEGNTPEPADVPPPPTKEVRITALQVAYDNDLDALNKAWLAALIADGAGEAARQAAIKTQMEELNAQLDLDILAIIMEE